MKIKPLTKEEIAQLKGGIKDGTSNFPPTENKTHNLNSASTCVCEFNNNAAIKNENSVTYCSCVCI